MEGTIYKTDFLKVVRGRKKLRMGQLKGNKFRILIRDIDDIEKSAEVANNILKELEVTGVPNYFGWQRFGKPRTNTHLVGEALVQNDLKEAVRNTLEILQVKNMKKIRRQDRLMMMEI